MEQKSFILGMVTAFCECVAADCKPLALSPPLTAAVFDRVAEEAGALIRRHGLNFYHEQNLDMPRDRRVHWLVIYGRGEALEAYLALRGAGLSPATDLDAFAGALGYGPNRIRSGYDAYHAYFGEGG